MGQVINRAIIVTSELRKDLIFAHDLARRLNLITSEISALLVNESSAFCIFPSGSKDGWTEEEKHIERLNKFEESIKIFDLCVHYIRVNFGEVDVPEITGHK